MKAIGLTLISAVLLVGAPATAGLGPPPSGDVGFSSEVCDGFSPSEVLDPNYPFDYADNEKECKQLCKAQVSMCESVARAQAACEFALLKGEGGAEKIDCNDSEAQGQCKSGVKQTTSVLAGSIKTQVGDERSSCREYKSFCENNCADD